jgi:hypothetical protein
MLQFEALLRQMQHNGTSTQHTVNVSAFIYLKSEAKFIVIQMKTAPAFGSTTCLLASFWANQSYINKMHSTQ